MTYFFEGALAGYGIAIPVGAIAVLIVEMGLRRGFRAGFSAGGGAAGADAIYASLAVIAGETLSEYLMPYMSSIRFLGGFILIAIGGYGLWRTVRADRELQAVGEVDQRGAWRIFLQFLGLTLLNPLTIVYFSVLILGGGVKVMTRPLDGLLFIAGAVLASLSWQTLLAGIGAFAHQRMTPRFQVVVSLIGFMVVIGFGLRMLIALI